MRRRYSARVPVTSTRRRRRKLARAQPGGHLARSRGICVQPALPRDRPPGPLCKLSFRPGLPQQGPRVENQLPQLALAVVHSRLDRRGLRLKRETVATCAEAVAAPRRPNLDTERRPRNNSPVASRSRLAGTNGAAGDAAARAWDSIRGGFERLTLVRRSAAKRRPPSAPEREAHAVWFVRQPGRGTVGPVPLPLVRRGLEAGRIPPGCEIRHEAWPYWRPMESVVQTLRARTRRRQSAA